MGHIKLRFIHPQRRLVLRVGQQEESVTGRNRARLARARAEVERH